MTTLKQEQSYISRGTIVMMSTFIAGFVFSYLFNVSLARIVGPHDYGNYKVAEAFISLGSLVAAMGGTKAASRFLPHHISAGSGEGVWEYTRFYLMIILFISSGLGLIVYVGHALHVSIFDTQGYHPLLLATFVIPFAAASALLSSVLQVARRLDLAYMPWRLGYPGLRLILCLLFFFVAGYLNDVTAVLITLVVCVILVMFQAFQVKRLSLIAIGRLSSVAAPKQWLSVSAPMMLVISLQVMMKQIDIYMIEFFTDEVAVGHFGAAQTCVYAIGTTQMALLNLIQPLVYPATQQGLQSIKELNRRAFLLMTKGIVVIATLTCVFGHQLLAVFGHDTHLAYLSLVTMTIGYSVAACLVFSQSWLQYSGSEKLIMVILIVSVLLNGVLNAILIPIYNIEGAAAGTAIALIFSGVVTAIYMKKRIGIYPWSRA
ncbi:Uncharacterised protein [BD1-7 clade bacterium]|uniref:Polysaccharide biosynthesis protein C-terminal domain-containing protein n=1 Tax=BD1-7 clade bacterium TaxID=2029982 RepID=A0A5S9NL41_9GAMM|nr:Uncharacterised protein [BD1-7 clade bacterium]CAA0093882.1 Uncharacterised protein [BD1-7 clade bacterium]